MLSAMRRTIRAILAGVAVSVVAVMLFGIALLEVVQEGVGRLLPAFVSDAAFGVLVDVVTLGLLAAPSSWSAAGTIREAIVRPAGTI